MSSSDVRSILNLPISVQSSSSHASHPKRPAATVKRPDGITRELYALIGSNAPSLASGGIPSSVVKYKDKPKTSKKKAKWEWTPFNPVARRESPVPLGHWVKVSDENPFRAVEHFGTFNLMGPSVMEYSQYEYDQHLTTPDWSSHETAYLFRLLRCYDLRFIVAADRYEYRGVDGDSTPRQRSIEDIKDRYYTICRRLIRTRTATDPLAQQQMVQSHSFDKAREIKRKQYASELFHLTAGEVAEEETLFMEVKRLEQHAKRYRAERDDLMRTLLGLDSGLIQLDQDHAEAILGVDKSKKRRRPEEIEAVLHSPASPAHKKIKDGGESDSALCIHRVPTLANNPNISHLAAKHPPLIPVHLRSNKLAQPKQSAAIRITDVLNELGISTQRLVMPTRSNVELYDSLLIAAGALVDMKRQVDRVEQELRTLKAQRDGLVAPILDRKMRSESVTSTDTSTTTNRRSRIS